MGTHNSFENSFCKQPHQLCKFRRGSFTLLEDFGVGQGAVDEPGGRVGSKGEHQHLQPHMPGREDLGHGRHPDHGSAGGAKHSYFCRGLEGGAQYRGIDALMDRKPGFLGSGARDGPEFGVVDLAHVREIGARTRCPTSRPTGWNPAD